ncbi:MAG: hypothetical protein QMC07_04620 [Flavobacteriaceae bacterium]
MKINIDKLFRNKIKEFKVTTPDGVWSAVETKLKRRRMLRFFGVSFVSFMGFMFLFFQAEKIVTTDLQKNTTTKQLVKEDSANKFSIVPEVKTPEKVSSFVSDKSKEGQLKLISSPKNSSKLSSNFIIKESIREESFQKVITNTVVEKQLKKFDSPVNNLDSLKKIKKKDLKKKRKELVKKNDAIDSIKFEKDKRKRWNIIPVLGVSNSGRFSKNTTTLGSQRAVTYPEKYFDDNQSSGLISNILGFNVVFRATNRISIQTGIISKELRFITEGLFLTEFIPDVNPTNIVYNPGVEVRFTNTPEIGGAYSESTSLTQTIVYMEMPFELKYRMFGNLKFNTNFVGGFSFLYLNKNEIQAKSNLLSRSIGKADNILTTSLSVNLGLDIEYHLSKRLVFNSAFMFKKHYNTYLNYGNEAAPYTIGMHAGIGYKF